LVAPLTGRGRTTSWRGHGPRVGALAVDSTTTNGDMGKATQPPRHS
jgi:hypothetical protein